VLASAVALGSEAANAQGIRLDADGRLSVEVRDTDPVAVIRQIAEQAAFKLVVSEGVQAAPGSWSFSGVPIESAIGRVLGNVDYILTRRTGDDLDAGIARVWILSKSTPVTSVSVGRVGAATDAADSQGINQALQKIAEFAQSDDPERTQGLLTFIDHPDRRVRRALASALGRIGDQEAVLALGQLMFGDAESAVRRSAASALAENQSEEAIEMLRGGLEDQDPKVKQHISSILQDIEGR
jgi:hypothetical protein